MSRRLLMAILVVALMAVTAACGGDDDTGNGDETEAPATGDFSDYIGLTEDEAGALADDEGRPWRVIERDGEPLAVTMDFVEDRLNFAVRDGAVTAVSTG